MKKFLKSSGTGWNLYIPKDILSLAGIEPSKHKVLFTKRDNVLFLEKLDPECEKNIEGLLVKKFHKNGNGWTLYMTNSILELLDVNPETDAVECDVNGHILSVKKAQ